MAITSGITPGLRPRRWTDYDPASNTFLDEDTGQRVRPDGSPAEPESFAPVPDGSSLEPFDMPDEPLMPRLIEDYARPALDRATEGARGLADFGLAGFQKVEETIAESPVGKAYQAISEPFAGEFTRQMYQEAGLDTPPGAVQDELSKRAGATSQEVYEKYPLPFTTGAVQEVLNPLTYLGPEEALRGGALLRKGVQATKGMPIGQSIKEVGGLGDEAAELGKIADDTLPPGAQTEGGVNARPPSSAAAQAGELPHTPDFSPDIPMPGPEAGIERGFTSRLRASDDLVSEPVRRVLDDNIQTYEQLGNATARTQAAARIMADPEMARLQALDITNTDPVTISIGTQLMRQADEAGDVKGFLEIAKALAKRGTARGQEIQLYSEIEKMTPEGVILEASRTIQKHIAAKGGKITPQLEKKLAVAEANAIVERARTSGRKGISDAEALTKFQMRQANDLMARYKRIDADISKEADKMIRAELMSRSAELKKHYNDLNILTGKIVPEARARAVSLENIARSKAKQMVVKNEFGLPENVALNLMTRAKGLSQMEKGFQQERAYARILTDIKNLVPPSKWDKVGQWLDIPRASQTAWDESYSFRQGWRTAIAHPKEWLATWGPMWKASFDPAYAEAKMERLATRPMANIWHGKQGAGLDFVEFGRDLMTGEEHFANKLLGKFPGYKGSERGYVVAGNTQRAGLADNYVKGWFPKGTDFSQINSIDEAAAVSGHSVKEFQDVARTYNTLTGRGSVQWLKGVLPQASNIFYSPRFAVSQIEPYEILANPFNGVAPQLRAEVADNLFRFYAVVGGAIATGVMGGIWESEGDPRSTNFGKVRFKGTQTWIDITGGSAAYIRLIAQLTTGMKKDSAGNLTSMSTDDAIWRFTRSKLAPVPGALWDFWRGQDPVGRSRDKTEPADVADAMWHMIGPITWHDVLDAAWETGLEDGVMDASVVKEAALASTSAVGFGANTYSTTTDVQNKVAKEMGYARDYKYLPKMDRDKIDASTEVAAKRAEFEEGTVDLKTKVNVKFDTYNESVANLESSDEPGSLGLKQYIDAGMKGKALKEKIQETMTARRILGNGILDDETMAEFSKNKTLPVEDVLRDAYMSADVPENPTTGELDFAAQKTEREAILKKADEMGIPREKVTYKKPPFKDPAVQKVYEEYQKDMETLKPYWEMKDKVKEMFAAYKDITEESKYYDIFMRDVSRERRTLRLKDAAIDKALQEWYGYDPLKIDSPGPKVPAPPAPPRPPRGY